MRFEVYRAPKGFKIQGIDADGNVVLQVQMSPEDAVAVGAALLNTPEVFDNSAAVAVAGEIAAEAAARKEREHD